jgi:uncharacterized RDD family membrane protein YckC
MANMNPHGMSAPPSAPGAVITAPPAPPVPSPGGGLPSGVAAASPGLRFGSYLLEAILMVVTLYIGWIIWACMTASTGQTPAKKLLKLRVIGADTLRPVGFGKMFFMRGIVGGIAASFAITFTLGILLFMPFWDKRRQNIWDKVSSTYVVTDPNDVWATNLR